MNGGASGGGRRRWTFPSGNEMAACAGAVAEGGPARRDCPECGGVGYVLVRGLVLDACMRCAREAEAAWLAMRAAPQGVRRAA